MYVVLLGDSVCTRYSDPYLCEQGMQEDDILDLFPLKQLQKQARGLGNKELVNLTFAL